MSVTLFGKVIRRKKLNKSVTVNKFIHTMYDDESEKNEFLI